MGCCFLGLLPSPYLLYSVLQIRGQFLCLLPASGTGLDSSFRISYTPGHNILLMPLVHWWQPFVLLDSKHLALKDHVFSYLRASICYLQAQQMVNVQCIIVEVCVCSQGIFFFFYWVLVISLRVRIERIFRWKLRPKEVEWLAQALPVRIRI